MSIELKVKFKTLSEETKIIRKEENKQKKYFRKIGVGYEYYNEHFAQFENLKNHRDNVVRKEARATHVARAYLKGMPYLRVEQSTHGWEYGLDKKIADMVSKYGGNEYHNTDANAISSWRQVKAAS